MKFLPIALLALAVTASAQQAPKRLYIEERSVTKTSAGTHCDTAGNCWTETKDRTRNTSAEATRLFTSSCPAVVVTGNTESADFTLKISPGNSVVYRKNGDVAYISPAKVKLGNVVKDVCKFLESAQ